MLIYPLNHLRRDNIDLNSLVAMNLTHRQNSTSSRPYNPVMSNHGRERARVPFRGGVVRKASCTNFLWVGSHPTALCGLDRYLHEPPPSLLRSSPNGTLCHAPTLTARSVVFKLWAVGSPQGGHGHLNLDYHIFLMVVKCNLSLNYNSR